eukprot:1178400-Amphidinium_carterae.1
MPCSIVVPCGLNDRRVKMSNKEGHTSADMQTCCRLGCGHACAILSTRCTLMRRMTLWMFCRLSLNAESISQSAGWVAGGYWSRIHIT